MDDIDKVLGVQIKADKAAAAETARIFRNTTEDTRKLVDLFSQVRSSGKSVSDGATESIKKTTFAIKENADAVAQMRKEYIEAAEAAKKLKSDDDDSGPGKLHTLRQVGRASSEIFGANPVSDVLKKVGEVGEITDALNLSIKKVETEAASAIPVVGNLSVAFAGVEVAIAPLLIPLAGIVAGAALVAHGLHEISEQAEKTAATEKALFDERQRQLLQGEQNRRAAKNTSSEQNAQNIDLLTEDRRQTREALDAANAARAKTSADYAALGSSFNPSERSRLGALGQQQDKDIEDLLKHLKDLDDQYVNAKYTLGPLIIEEEKRKKLLADQADAYKTAQKAIGDVASREQELYKLRQGSSAKAVEAMIDENTNSIRIKEAQAREQKKLLDQQTAGTDTYKEAKRVYDETVESINKLKQSNKDLKDSVLPIVEARQREVEATKAATDAQNKYLSSLEKWRSITAEISQMQEDHAKKIARQEEDDERDSYRRGVEADYARRIKEAKAAESIQKVRDDADKATEEAIIKNNESVAAADQKFFDDSLAALDSYIEDERKLGAKANKEKLRTLEDAQRDLKNLAAAGDVAAFIERQEQARSDLKRQAEDAKEAQDERREQYENELKAAENAHRKQLDELQKSFAREQAARDEAAEIRIQQIQAQESEVMSLSETLEQELQAQREQWRLDDLQRQRDDEEAAYNERLELQHQKQQEILDETEGFYNEWLTYIMAANAAAYAAGDLGEDPQRDQAAQYGGRFAIGLPFVPRDDYPARLDYGERVLTARENAEYSSGGSKLTVVVYQNNTVGNVATMEYVEEAQRHIVSGTVAAIRASRGQGNG